MEILLWLVPTVMVTLLAMCWVSWLSRDGRGEVDRDVVNARFAAAMRREHPGLGRRTPVRPRDRSTGIAVRPSRTGPAETRNITGGQTRPGA
jgi:hypothetical protein